MNEPTNPARFYRHAVRQLCVRYQPSPDSDSDARFYAYLERQYNYEKKQLVSLVAANAGISQQISARNGIFVLAVGLFTFGRLDVVDDILINIPRSGDIRNLAMILNAMLPLPEETDVQNNPIGASEWVKVNRPNLEWNEDAGRFLLVESI